MTTESIPRAYPRAPLGAWLHQDRLKWSAYGYEDAQRGLPRQATATIPAPMRESYEAGYAAGQEAKA